MDRVRLGLAGVGNVAPLSVVGYLEDERCDLVAVADPRIDKARGAAEAWGAERAYPSLAELIADDEIDAVEILTPTHLHHEHVLAALAAGKHVSCQKPLTNTVAESRELAAAAVEAGRYLRVSECFYHYPPLVRAKQLVEAGVIGDPIGLRVKTVCGRTDSPFEIGLEVEGYLWRLDARSPGGHIFDDMIHKFAMVPWLVGKTVTSVRALVGREDLFYEPFAAIIEYDDPCCRAVVDSHYAKDMPVRSSYYGADEFFEIQGTKGLIWVTRCTGELLDLPALFVLDGEGRRTWDDSVNADWGEGFKGAARHFIDCILAGKQPDMNPGAAIESLQLCFAAYESARTGQAVDPRTIEDKVVAVGWPT